MEYDKLMAILFDGGDPGEAAELGLKDTHFVDASGLHDENHYTTLRDIVLVCASISSTPSL